MGGDGDIGANMLPEDAEAIKARLASGQYKFYEEPDLAANVQTRLEIYGDMKALVVVGGNVTSAGTTAGALTLGQGVLQPSKFSGALVPSADDGVIQYALAENVPVIHYLNIKKIVASYGMPFDPVEQEAIGTGSVYRMVHYAKWRIAAAVIAGVAVLLQLRRKRVEYE
jgi:poly-gamma-glutamate system protein